MVTEKQFGYTGVTAGTAPTIRRLAALAPRTLGVMHGSSFSGNTGPVLGALADFYAPLLQEGTGARPS